MRSIIYTMVPDILDTWYLVCNHISSATKSRLASRETGDGLTGTESGEYLLEPPMTTDCIVATLHVPDASVPFGSWFVPSDFCFCTIVWLFCIEKPFSLVLIKHDTVVTIWQPSLSSNCLTARSSKLQSCDRNIIKSKFKIMSSFQILDTWY